MIFIDTNVISETVRKQPSEAVTAWLSRFDVELALSTVVIAEIAFGIAKVAPNERSARLKSGLGLWRSRFSHRLFGFTEDAALAYGELMGNAVRRGRPMSVQDGMIAAIALVNGGRLATRNVSHFTDIGLRLINPWEH